MLDGMTNTKASEVLKELKVYTEDLPHYSPDEVAEAIEMAIQALEIVNDFESARIITGGRLNGRTHAYKCGLADGQRLAKGEKIFNVLPLEQQPCEDAVSRKSLEQISQEYMDALKNLHEIEALMYVIPLVKRLLDLPSVQPQTVTEFADKCKECGKIQNEFFNFDAPMVKKSDAVSREAVIRLVDQHPNIIGNRCSGLIADIKHLPSVTPQASEEDIHREREQAYMLGYEDASKKFRTEPSEDCISRQAVLEHICEDKECYKEECKGRTLKRCYDLQWVFDLPPVTPSNADIREAYIKGYDYGVKDWFKDKTQPCEDCVSRAYIESIVEELENICINGDEHILSLLSDIKNAPSETPQPKKGKWIIVDDCEQFIAKCSVCENIEDSRLVHRINFCPNCKTKMEGVEDDSL